MTFALALSAAIGGAYGVLWLARSHWHARAEQRRYQMHDWILHEHTERLKAAASAELYRRPHVVKADFQRRGTGR